MSDVGGLSRQKQLLSELVLHPLQHSAIDGELEIEKLLGMNCPSFRYPVS